MWISSQQEPSEEVFMMNQRPNNDNPGKPYYYPRVHAMYDNFDNEPNAFSSSSISDDPFSDKRTKEIADVLFRTKKNGTLSYKEKDSHKDENFDVLDIQTKERYLVFKDVIQERERQTRKWGEQRHNSNETWNVIGVEEVGEVAKAIYDKDAVSHLYEEIIQVAAVYVAWAESIQREGTL